MPLIVIDNGVWQFGTPAGNGITPVQTLILGDTFLAQPDRAGIATLVRGGHRNIDKTIIGSFLRLWPGEDGRYFRPPPLGGVVRPFLLPTPPYFSDFVRVDLDAFPQLVAGRFVRARRGPVPVVMTASGAKSLYGLDYGVLGDFTYQRAPRGWNCHVTLHRLLEL